MSIEEVKTRPSWDDYFMDIAFVISQKSIDPSTKHGCVVVDEDKGILSVGYNSPPRGCIDQLIPLTRPEKYAFLLHSEENCIIHAARCGISLMGSTFYITGYPCSRCFRGIINVGAKKVIYGPIPSACVSEQEFCEIDLMNRTSCGIDKVIIEKYKGKEGVVLRSALDYMNKKCGTLLYNSRNLRGE